MKNNISSMFKPRSVIMMLLGLLFCSLGVVLQSNSSFGVGVLQTVPYALFEYLSPTWPAYTYGVSCYITEGIFLILLCIIIRRFRLRFLFSFLTAFIFGLILDLWILIIGSNVPESFDTRVILWALGHACICFAVACYFRTKLPQEVWDLFVTQFSERFNLKLSRVKWGFDISVMIIGIILSMILFKKYRLDIIGPGTIASALLGGPTIGLFGKFIDRFYPEKNEEQA